MILFYHFMDDFQTTNEWSITLSIIVLIHCIIQVLLFNATWWFSWNIRILVLFNHRSIIDIAFSSTIYVNNEIENKVVGVVFTYPWCEGTGRIDLELCFAK